MHVGEAEVASAEAIGQAFVIDAEQVQRHTATIAVLVDDTDPANAMAFPSTLVERKALPRGPDYVISTPALFAVKDGIVTGFASDPDDVASVDACIASNAQ